MSIYRYVDGVDREQTRYDDVDDQGNTSHTYEPPETDESIELEAVEYEAPVIDRQQIQAEKTTESRGGEK